MPRDRTPRGHRMMVRAKNIASMAALAVLICTWGADSKSRFSVLYTFGGGSDGAEPYAGLMADRSGNLYGTTEAGGASGFGTAFRLAPDGTKTILHSFAGGSDGINPYSGVISDNSGNLYGTTYQGGAHGDGTVFEIAANGTETVLYAFDDQSGSDGADPYAGLVRDKHGNLYGTTSVGGAHGQGSVFRIASNGTETVLYSFNDSSANDGAAPYAPLIMDAHGNLYGTTTVGGAHGQGTVFEIGRDGSEKLVYSFNDSSANDGADPYAPLIMDSNGNLYGTTKVGGANGQGTVFEVAPDGSEKVLYSFNDHSANDGADPYAGLISDSRGNLYGTTSVGGANGVGSIFRLAPTGTETLVYSFTGGSDGAIPEAGLIRDKILGGKTRLFGTATVGGNGEGTIFEIKQ